MPKYFCAFVVLKYECEFKVSELLNTACHGIFAKIQFDARSQQVAQRKKFPAQTTTRPRPGTTPDRILRNRNLHQTNKK